MVVMKLPRILNRLINLFSFTGALHAKEAMTLRPSPSAPSMDMMCSGSSCNIAYRESCRNSNQRKARKNFRRLIAAGGV